MISTFFINRPVLANVLAIVMVLIGAVSLYTLPIAQYPNVVPPTISVTTRYPGASAQTVIDTVALPIEQQVNGVNGMIYMQSTSAADGTYSLTVTFQIGTDINFAQVLVQNRVSSALAQLPQAVQAQGVTVQQKSTAILEIVALTSPDQRYDSLYMSNYATINLVNELSRLPGVGNVNVFGVGQYSMRVWLDPDKLKARGLIPADVVAVIQQQSQVVTAGQVGAPPAPAGQDFQYTVNIDGRLNDPEAFANLIVKVASGTTDQITRLRDIGRVELGAQTYSQSFKVDGKPAAGMAIFQTLDANALDVAHRVAAKMDELAPTFPQGLTYSVPFDTTGFVTTSIHEVYKTLIEAGVLVLVVILVFLQNFRAMLVPATTVPVTIIGAFAAMAALGFTVNLSTLFAIILAIGIVVDDAIVIVESVSRHIEEGMTPHDGAIKAMDELVGPIIGITLVLMSVFIPAAFLPGLTGKMFAQFALVIAATAVISAINALTLKPTQCAMWLRAPVPLDQRNFFYRGFNNGFGRLERGYTRLIGGMVTHSIPMVGVAVVLIGVAFWGIGRIPTAFIPTEDQGYVIVSLRLPDGASIERTQAALDQVTKIAKATPGVETVVEIAGISVLDNSATLANGAAAYVILKDWGVRGKAKGEDLRSIYQNLTQGMATLPDGAGFVVIPPPIQGIGNAGGFNLQIEQRDGSFDYNKMARVVAEMAGDGRSQSGIQAIITSFSNAAPQTRVVVDRVKAEALHVGVGDVFASLASYLGSTYVAQFNKFGRTFQVYIQAESGFRLKPKDIEGLNVRAADGGMVPLGSLVEIREETGPSLISLYNLYLTASVVGSPSPGFSSGQAMDLMTQVADRDLPRGSAIEWTGMSYQEKAVGNQILYVFGLGILLVYLCLAGQYESWIAPFSVILAVPLALIGPAIALGALSLANNLYTQIGLILLIALSAKNAILIVEVAREHRHAGRSIVDSAVDAARVRLRPILMTSFAFILGVLPLVLASGAGASARISLGLSVFTGMIASTCLTVLFVPSFFALLQRFEERGGKKKGGGPPQVAASDRPLEPVQRL